MFATNIFGLAEVEYCTASKLVKGKTILLPNFLSPLFHWMGSSWVITLRIFPLHLV
jgi:hypothetical protein